MTHHYREDTKLGKVKSIKWAESISEKTCQALRDLGWADPNQIQEVKSELNHIQATMMVNFGPKGKTRPNLITGNENLNHMIVKVFTYYEEQNK